MLLAGIGLLVLLLLLLARPYAVLGGEATGTRAPERDPSALDASPPAWAMDSPVGPLEYRQLQGLRIGKTGLNIGGFTTLEGTRLEGEPGTFAIDGITFLLLYEPVHYFHLFSELEIADILEVGGGDVTSDTELDVDRLYGEIGASDALNLRVGQFLTPVGLWNPVLAEPLLWTTSDPLITEFAFDEVTNGAMVRGSLFPASGSLSYQFYGQYLDPIDPEPDPDVSRSHHGTGFYLDYSGADGSWSTGTSFLASERDGEWSFLGGLDGAWYRGPLEITAELLFSGGDRADRRVWGTYVQGVYEVVPRVYLVGRYEYFDPAEGAARVNVFDVGFAWAPRPYLLLKADYSFVDHSSDVAAPGFRGSFSILF